jgi:Tryptophan-associated transmembrane protein (Trp_oprn_chp)
MLRAPGCACDTPAMSQVLDTSRPTPLRFFGFVFTALGGLLIAGGALQTWATVSLVNDTEGVLDTAITGVDRAEGVAALTMGVVMLVGVVVLRLLTSTPARRLVSLVITVCAVASLAIGILDLAATRDRFDDDGGQAMIETVSRERNIPIDEVRRRYEEAGSSVIDVTAGIGLWVLVAGGALGLVGGLLDLAWVGQQRLRDASLPADSSE